MIQPKAILMAVLLCGGAVAFAMQSTRARELSQIHEDLQAISTAITSHQLRNGSWPTNLAQLIEGDEHGIRHQAKKPVLPVDPWGRDYHYRIGRVSSLGADGMPGGSGLDGDHVLDVTQGRCSCGAN